MAPSDLQQAQIASVAEPEDEQLRTAFYARLVETEFCLLLSEAATNEQMTPNLYTEGDNRYVIAFEDEGDLLEFNQEAAHFAALPGRALVQMLVGHDVGLLINGNDLEKSILLSTKHISWLAETLSQAPQERSGALSDILAPEPIKAEHRAAIQDQLHKCAGLLVEAYHITVVEQEQNQRQTLIFSGTTEASAKQIAQMIQDVVSFQDDPSLDLDVAFLDFRAPIMQHIRQIGSAFDVPFPEAPATPKAPGSDPDNPPKLS